MVSIANNKPLSVLSLVMINIIAIDSLRNLSINAVSGFSLVFYYLLAYLFFLIPCALVTSEFSSHYPKTGGAYVWVREAFGKRSALTAIWLQWVYNVFWYPTILAFVAANVAYLINPALVDNKFYMVSMIIGFFTIATLMNIFGMRTSALTSIISAVVGTIIPMMLIIGLGFFWILKGKALAIDLNATSLIPHHFDKSNLAFFVIILFSVFGLEMSATHAESVKNPRKNYPKALLISAIFIIVTLVLSSLAIAIIVPEKDLSLVGGLNQAFKIFLDNTHLSFLFPLIIVAIIIGSFGNMAAWVIGPTKGLVVATEDGLLPKFFSYQNRFGSPIIILVSQAIIVFLLCIFFLTIKSFNISYWILSDLAAQLAILFYVFFFAAGIKLHKTTPPKFNTFRLKNWAMNLCCGVGLLSCLAAFTLGFVPPQSVNIHSITTYEIILVGGIIIFTLAPLFLSRFSYPLQK